MTRRPHPIDATYLGVETSPGATGSILLMDYIIETYLTLKGIWLLHIFQPRGAPFL